MLKQQPDTSSLHPSKKPASSSSSTTHATPAVAPRTPCWKCKQTGHWANDCPNKTVTFDTPKPSLLKPTGSSTPASSFGIIHPMVHEPPPAKKAPVLCSYESTKYVSLTWGRLIGCRVRCLFEPIMS
jgi:hypothetical protein